MGRAVVAFIAVLTIFPSLGRANDSPTAPAKLPAPPPSAVADLGFWKILVKPKAHWVLYDVVDTNKPKHRRAIGGSWAPDDGLYAQGGYESPFVHSP